MVSVDNKEIFDKLVESDFKKLIWIPSIEWVKQGNWKYIFSKLPSEQLFNTIKLTHEEYFIKYQNIVHNS